MLGDGFHSQVVSIIYNFMTLTKDDIVWRYVYLLM